MNDRELLESRIVAMLLGEASDFEKARLAEEMASDPELAAFAREVETLVHALPDAVAPRPDSAGWRIAPARRKDLLRALGLPAEKPANVFPQAPTGRFSPPFWKIAIPVTAAAALVLLLLALPATTGALRRSAPLQIPEFAGEAGGFVMAEPAKDGSELSFSVGMADTDLLASNAPQAAALPQSAPAITTAPAARMAASAPVPADTPAAEAEAPAPSIAALDAGVSSQIRNFTAGWGRGSGSGTGVRAEAPERRRTAATEEKGEVSGREQDRVAMFKENSSRADKDGLVQYGASIAAKTAEAPAQVTAPHSRTSEFEGAKSKRETAPGESRPVKRRMFENETSSNAVSTFSLHVADVSFRLAEEALLQRGELPDPSSVRPEEFVAAFDYADPAPERGEAVAIAVEQARHPALPGTNLVRISVRAGEEGRAGDQPLNLIVLLDKSGSMERTDRAGAARRAIEALASQLRPADRVTIATFDRTLRLAADALPGAQAVPRLLEELATFGDSGTNLEEALAQLGGLAPARFVPEASNRIVLVTDGIANLGKTLPGSLAEGAGRLRKAGFPVDVVAVGARGTDDAVLEALARKADGRYFLLPDASASAAEFARQLAGAFRPAASNVKVQVRFNPSRVLAWSLIGFDEHRLRERDFRDDKINAAELAAAEQGTAVYLVQLDPQGTGEIGRVSVRFRQTASGEMIERARIIAFDPAAPPLENAPPAMRIAGCAALLAEKLRGGPPAEGVSASSLAAMLRDLPASWRKTPRVLLLERMLQTHSRLVPEP